MYRHYKAPTLQTRFNQTNSTVQCSSLDWVFKMGDISEFAKSYPKFVHKLDDNYHDGDSIRVLKLMNTCNYDGVYFTKYDYTRCDVCCYVPFDKNENYVLVFSELRFDEDTLDAIMNEKNLLISSRIATRERSTRSLIKTSVKKSSKKKRGKNRQTGNFLLFCLSSFPPNFFYFFFYFFLFFCLFLSFYTADAPKMMPPFPPHIFPFACVRSCNFNVQLQSC